MSRVGVILLSLLLSCTAGFAAPSPAEAGYEELFKQVRTTSWALYLRETGGIRAVCSSTAFHSDTVKTYLLTAGHCVIGNDMKRTDMMVTQDHRMFFPAQLHKSGLIPRKNTRDNSASMDDYQGNDWAVLVADVGQRPTLAIGSSADLSIGEDLIMVGVPFGLDFLAVQGVVGSTDVSMSTLVWNHYFGANIFVAGGNSGGGVVSTKQKKVVGIVNAGPGSQSSMMVFMPVKLLPVDVLSPPKAGNNTPPTSEMDHARP